MKQIFFKSKLLYVVAACIMLASLSGCDKVDNPYYFVDPVPVDSLSAVSFKKVLLEDYTGIRCNNCPAASRLAEEIAASSRHRLIIMNVHAGHLAAPASPPFTLDLRCHEGIAYYKDFNITGNPKGLINRTQKSAGIFEYSSSEWAKAIETELQQPQTFKLKVEEAELSKNRTAIWAKITYSATAAATAEYNLLAFLVEDGIVGTQQDGPKIEQEYVFHNVLRETLHGDAIYGIPIEKPIEGKEYVYTFESYQIKSIDKKYPTSSYKLIVAIVQRDSKYVEQVEEVELK